jgi:hypothetical protein
MKPKKIKFNLLFLANRVCKIPNDPNYPECATKVEVRIFPLKNKVGYSLLL